MDQIMTQRRLALPARVRALTATLSWHRLALTAILALSAFLAFYRLDQAGFANAYYAATVKSMLTSWHNFFYASYDPGGFVTVDKPPLGFWLQAASAKLLGFSPFSLLLPQALAAVGAVAVLYRLVRRHFGPTAGLIGALALAVAPINVATGRNNTIDSTLVLVVLLAAWAVSRAAETGRPRWLLLGMALVGVGFNIKMLQAYLVVPALVALYFLSARARWWQRLGHLVLAGVVLLAVSLSWALAVELTPPDRRPYVGGSENNSVLNLALGYNGINRLLGQGGRSGMQLAQSVSPPPDQAAQAAQSGTSNAPRGCDPAGQSGGAQVMCVNGGGGPGGENGERGPLRLLSKQLAGQVSWLLPLALLGLLAAGWQERPRWPLTPRQGALVLWGVWLLTAVAFFSAAAFYHRYYLVMLSPAIAALVGIGVAALWHDYRHRRWRGWLLPPALVGAVAAQASILTPFPEWGRRLTPAIAGLCLLAAATLVAAGILARKRAPTSRLRAIGRIAVTVGFLALLIAPLAWISYPVRDPQATIFPAAGPREEEVFGITPGASGAPPRRPVDATGAAADPKLVEYLLAHRGGARYLVATQSAAGASSLILATGQPVMALGGFGGDQILTLEQLERLVRGGTVRYFLVPSEEEGGPIVFGQGDATSGGQPATPGRQGGHGGASPAGAARRSNDVVSWVHQHCQKVPAEQWRSAPAGDGAAAGPGGPDSLLGETLYDCGARGE